MDDDLRSPPKKKTYHCIICIFPGAAVFVRNLLLQLCVALPPFQAKLSFDHGDFDVLDLSNLNYGCVIIIISSAPNT